MELLKRGDAIGIVSPGSPASREILEKGLEKLKKMGFIPVPGEHVFDVTGHTAGFAKDRSSDINRFFADSNIKGIIAVRGGYNCNQILPYLDYTLIKRCPKIFLGLSDVTCVLNAINAKSGIMTFHGPVLLMIGGGRDGKAFSGYSKTNFRKVLMGKTRRNIIIKNKNISWIVLKKGKAKGKVLGGNLPSLVSIIGTPYEPDWKDAILIWECVGEKIEMMDQMLTHLKLHGVFEKIRGMIIGKISDPQPKDDPSLEKKIEGMVLQQCNEYYFPIIYSVDFGHGNNNLVLPIGGLLEFDTENDYLKILNY